jgi:hypothetical protein
LRRRPTAAWRSLAVPALLLLVGACHRDPSRIPTKRDRVLAAQRARPDDPWPRGLGHVLLGIPGSRLEDKGYLEPCGSFSPGFGSFGVALWELASDGSFATTSDAIPLDAVWPAVGVRRGRAA